MWRSILVLLVSFGSTYQECFQTNPTSPGIISEAELSGITDFGLDIYRQFSSDFGSRNFVFSPYSLWNALVLTYFGTLGTTQAQLESALRVSDKFSAHEVKKGLDNWYELLQQNNPGYYFSVANRIYFDVLLNIRPCIRKILPDEIKLGYLFDSKSTARYINDFVEKSTRGLIGDIASPQDFVDVQMVVVNAAVFKGMWKYEFQPRDNTRMQFKVSPDISVDVVMMRQRRDLRYGESEELGARVLELPYSGDQIAMFLLLPQTSRPAEDRFLNMINNLNSRTLADAVAPKNLEVQDIDLALPKFSFSVEIGHHLEKALMDLGIVDLFDEEKANLTGFTMKRGLAVSQTLHKSFVEVNEEGTQAAGATAVLVTFRSSEEVFEPVPFYLVEPFLFLICDKDTKNPLFLGHVRNPFGIQKTEL